MIKPRCLFFFVAGLLTATHADFTVSVENPLQLSWPLDLTYVQIPDSQAGSLQSVIMPNGSRRPLQMQTVDGETRAWFVATLDATPTHSLQLKSSPAPAGIQVTEQGDYYVLNNGVYEFRLLKGKVFSTPVPLNEAPHWNGGMRVKGQSAWDGRTWFEGNGKVKAIEVRFEQQGPVFVDAHIRYIFETDSDGMTPALPLELGKQTHNWEPNTPPREEISKQQHAYECKIRVVMNDPWLEVNERFHFPRIPDANAYGIHQYWMNWGAPADTPELPGFEKNAYLDVDTVTWVRWFLYDQFGGNTDQQWVPATPRADQKGRPFALLRPRWNQGGGGAQDFFFTAGGPQPAGIKYLLDRKLKNGIRELQKNGSPQQKERIETLLASAKNDLLPYLKRLQAAAEIGEMTGNPVSLPPEEFSPDNPAMGLVAAFASKWVGPYPGTIAAYAYDGNRTRARFPLIDGERSGMHYGQRAYALWAGPRSGITHLNNLVRRHTDWTLVAQMNKYQLTWPRDPAKAGPNAKITKEKLAALEESYRSGKGMAAEIIRAQTPELNQLLDEYTQLETQIQQARETSRNRDLSSTRRDEAKAKEKELRGQQKEVEKKLAASDMQLLRMITKNWRKDVKIPSAELWIQRRYQDDFLNPTQRIPRSIADYADADLFAGGKPLGGPWHAALGYIATDLDSWPGWLQGWSPGNPNFHTDKYMGAIYIASAMHDHPHSHEWLAYGWDNFQQDLSKVLAAPDGTGYECPGYSGYSLRHQLSLAKIFLNLGYGNPVVDNPLFKGTGRWHRKLITPYDPRIERRHAAPIGDTHRWDSGFGHGFGTLAMFYKQDDPEFASEMQGAWKLLTDNGLRIKSPLKTRLLESDPDIPPMDPEKMDWSSEVFHGFGALMRHNFGDEQETFLSVKAGPLRGHYHNDELAYHFYANGHPVSLDYNCSYHPRGDHAALHNSMTFGHEQEIRHNQRQEQVPAMEQMTATAWPGAFASDSGMDVLVAERKQQELSLGPIYPHDHEFGRNYPHRKTETLVHRRFTALIKHAPGSDFQDYLVIRDETRGDQPQAVNIHLLAREAEQQGNLILANGQYEMDMAVYVAEATGLEVEHRRWFYEDEWMIGPGEMYEYRPGETQAEWAARMEALKRKHGVDSLPLPGWEPKWKRDDESKHGKWMKLIHQTNGKALLPPPGWNASWMYGEYQHWLRLNTDPGTPVLWVLYPYPKGSEPPTFASIGNGTGVRVTLNGKSEEIWLATEPAKGVSGQAVLRQNGETRELLSATAVPALGTIPQKPL